LSLKEKVERLLRLFARRVFCSSTGRYIIIIMPPKTTRQKNPVRGARGSAAAALPTPTPAAAAAAPPAVAATAPAAAAAATAATPAAAPAAAAAAPAEPAAAEQEVSVARLLDVLEKMAETNRKALEGREPRPAADALTAPSPDEVAAAAAPLLPAQVAPAPGGHQLLMERQATLLAELRASGLSPSLPHMQVAPAPGGPTEHQLLMEQQAKLLADFRAAGLSPPHGTGAPQGDLGSFFALKTQGYTPDAQGAPATTYHLGGGTGAHAPFLLRCLRLGLAPSGSSLISLA